jgi:hypothetical protein
MDRGCRRAQDSRNGAEPAGNVHRQQKRLARISGGKENVEDSKTFQVSALVLIFRFDLKFESCP